MRQIDYREHISIAKSVNVRKTKYEKRTVLPFGDVIALEVQRLAAALERFKKSYGDLPVGPERFMRCLRAWLSRRLENCRALAPLSSLSTDLQRRIVRGARFIASRQSVDGHFASEVSLTPNMRDCHEERSVYLHSYILQALSGVCEPLPLIESILQSAAGNLRFMQEKSGWWKFYGPYSAEPPDDVDDTSVAFSALLSLAGPINEQLVKEANTWLDSLERLRSESGLYKTWAEASWNAECFELPDVVVNANVLFMQSMLGRPDPRVAEYLERVVRDQTYQLLNLYGVSIYAVPFLISRSNYPGNVFVLQPSSMTRLRDYILCRQEQDGGWGGALDSVLALLTLLNSGHSGAEVGRAVAFLCERQQSDGGWESGPLFRDLQPRYYGSRSLTTSFCLEALSRLSVYD